jgi:hypothetical protein
VIELNSGNVVGDNLWLWRADHSKGGVLVLPPQQKARNKKKQKKKRNKIER